MKPAIAIFKHDPECSHECVDGMVEALSGEFEIKIFGEAGFEKETFDDIDIVAFPGGVGDSDKYYEFFKRREGNAVADFVARGGKYLGVCMGAYWAGRDYFDLLDKLQPVQYIKRAASDIKRSYATTAQVDWGGKVTRMFFYDGPTFIGDGRAQHHARYGNGDPMAIIQGRVGLIGCHPESREGWYEQFGYIKKHWHGGEHHALLLSFTKKLLRQK
jgi:Biotin-protein ligase, N terminal